MKRTGNKSLGKITGKLIRKRLTETGRVTEKLISGPPRNRQGKYLSRGSTGDPRFDIREVERVSPTKKREEKGIRKRKKERKGGGRER